VSNFLRPELFIYLFALAIPFSVSGAAVPMMALLLLAVYRLAVTRDWRLIPRGFWLFVAMFAWQSAASAANGLWGQFGRNLWDKSPLFTVGGLKIEKAVLERALKLLFWSSLVLILYGLLQRYAGFPVVYREMFTPDGRFRGLSSHPLRFAGFISTVGIMSLAAALFYSRRAYAFFAVISAGMFMTGSRSYMISYTLACALLAFWKSRKAFIRFVYSGAIGFGLLLLAYKPAMERVAGTFAAGHDQIRYNIWSVAWKAFTENPVFGLGVRQLPKYMEPYYASGFTDNASHAHNIYLSALAEEGFIGLVLMLAVFAYFLRRYLKAAAAAADPLTRALAFGLSAALANLLVSGVFEAHFYTFGVWSLMTFLMGLYEGAERAQRGGIAASPRS
jgi:O-antigen ligase